MTNCFASYSEISSAKESNIGNNNKITRLKANMCVY